WSKIAPLFGLLFVLFVVGSVFAAPNTPATNASTASILHYYRTHKNQVGISALLIPPAVVFGLIWFSYLRSWLQRRDVDQRWGIITFAGGVLFAVTGGVAGAYSRGERTISVSLRHLSGRTEEVACAPCTSCFDSRAATDGQTIAWRRHDLAEGGQGGGMLLHVGVVYR
ncbi:MAG: hypothetical protein ABSE84_19085, partial [Isosphaeraceae bacterium]